MEDKITTIAYRNGIMAGDTRATSDNVVEPGNFRKVFKFKDGSLLGMAGDVVEIVSIANQLKKHPEKVMTVKPVGDFDAILVKPDGHVMELDGTGWIHSDAKFHAVGSGRLAALVAMYCGKSAAEAVKIAIKFDRNTGGRVQTVKLK